LLVPEQWSAASLSHTPLCEAPVQLVDAEAKPFAGQIALEPVHCAATSQGPAAARHSVPAFPAGCAHAPAPSHTSSVQTLPSLVQGVAAAVWQLSAASLQLLSHSGPPAHGSPLCVQTPALQLSAPLQKSPSSQVVPLALLGCVHAGALTLPLHTSVVHGLSSSVQLVPAGSTVSEPQLELGGASAMSWLRLAVCEVDAFEPVAPGLACDASALSEAASTELVPLEDSAWNRSVMPDGAPTAKLSERPKQATSIVL